ncbi:MAG: hypothetical protein ACI9ES_001552 [Oceanospirillaceae bacterium]|jgi:hypothetical protein
MVFFSKNNPFIRRESKPSAITLLDVLERHAAGLFDHSPLKICSDELSARELSIALKKK